MPKVSASGILIEKAPQEIALEQEDMVAILALMLVERPAVSDISQLLGAALCAAYARGFEAGQRVKVAADDRRSAIE